MITFYEEKHDNDVDDDRNRRRGGRPKRPETFQPLNAIPYSGSAGLHSGCCDVVRGAQRGLIQFRILFEIIITICSFFFGGPHGPR